MTEGNKDSHNTLVTIRDGKILAVMESSNDFQFMFLFEDERGNRFVLFSEMPWTDNLRVGMIELIGEINTRNVTCRVNIDILNEPPHYAAWLKQPQVPAARNAKRIPQRTAASTSREA